MFLNPTNSTFLVVVCFLIWRVGRRIRRHIGRQPVRTFRMAFRIVFLSVVALVLAVVSPHQASFEFGLGGGLFLGVLLALLGLRLTQFEYTTEGRFFTPNMYMGIGISALLLARLGYQVARYKTMAEQHEAGTYSMVQSSLTLLLFGLLAGYYIAYYTGIFICTRNLGAAKTNA
jgi:hypothetical protein